MYTCMYLHRSKNISDVYVKYSAALFRTVKYLYFPNLRVNYPIKPQFGYQNIVINAPYAKEFSVNVPLPFLHKLNT